MKTIISGKDWSEIEDIDVIMHVGDSDDIAGASDDLNNNASNINQEDGDVKSSDNNEDHNENGFGGADNNSASNNVDSANTSAQKSENLEVLLSKDYFQRYKSLFGNSPSPFNLGVYQTPSQAKDKDGDILKATKYVGIVPMLKINDNSNSRSSEHIIKISSRFGISPIEMIDTVLKGEDYYDNPKMLVTKSYSASEWRELEGKNDRSTSDDEKILFGLVNGLDNIDLKQENGEGDQDVSDIDVGIVDTFGVFETIDFVNKAKKLCKNNLKRQSQRVEENLNCKVKGRILIQKQIKYNVSRGQNQKTYCAYNKMSEDIRENQIIKYALHLCQKNHGIGDSLAEDINYCLNALRGVPLKKCSMSDFVGLKNNGAYRQYKETLNAAKKIISRYSISYGDKKDNTSDNDPGEKVSLHSYKVLPYFIDMNLLFEYYCRALLREAIDIFNKQEKENDKKVVLELESTEYAKRKMFEDEETIGKFYMKTYIPDMVINYSIEEKDDKHEGVAAVVDAKYSIVEGSQERRPRTHQVLFYMKALGCEYGGLMSPGKEKDDTNNTDKDIISRADISINNIHNKGPSEVDGVQPALSYIPLSQTEDNTNLGEDDENLKRLDEIVDNDDRLKELSDLTKMHIKVVLRYLMDIREGIDKLEKDRLKRDFVRKLESFADNGELFTDKGMIRKEKAQEIERYLMQIKPSVSKEKKSEGGIDDEQ